MSEGSPPSQGPLPANASHHVDHLTRRSTRGQARRPHVVACLPSPLPITLEVSLRIHTHPRLPTWVAVRALWEGVGDWHARPRLMPCPFGAGRLRPTPRRGCALARVLEAVGPRGRGPIARSAALACAARPWLGRWSAGLARRRPASQETCNQDGRYAEALARTPGCVGVPAARALSVRPARRRTGRGPCLARSDSREESSSPVALYFVDRRHLPQRSVDCQDVRRAVATVMFPGVLPAG